MSNQPPVIELVERVEEDISKRQLKPGDPYLNTARVASMLRVNTAVANRVMQALVKRRVIERKQRTGTFVARNFGQLESGPIDRLHFLVQQDYLKTEGLMADGVLLGVQGELPTARLQFDFCSPHTDESLLDRIVQDSLKGAHRDAFVLVRASLAAQRILAGSGLPTVVYGSVYPSVEELPSLDRDHTKIGRLCVDHLVACGCRSLLVLSREHVLPGDHPFLRSTREQAGCHKIAVIDELFLPVDTALIIKSVELCLARRKSGPVGIVARSEPLAMAADLAMRELGRRHGKDYFMVVSDIYRKSQSQKRNWPYIDTEITPEQIGELLGRMLLRRANEPQAPISHDLLDVKITSDE